MTLQRQKEPGEIESILKNALINTSIKNSNQLVLQKIEDVSGNLVILYLELYLFLIPQFANFCFTPYYTIRETLLCSVFIY